MSHPKLEQDEIDLFRRSVGAVTPLRQDKVQHQQNKPKPKPRKLAHAIGVPAERVDGFFDTEEIEIGGELSYRRPGLQVREFQKLRRRKFAISEELYLRGLTLETAKDRLADFLARRNQKYVKIIHGKGLGSKQGNPTIRSKIGKWLKQRPEVLAFCPARQNDGGPARQNDGALYVLLKNQE